MSRQKRPVRLLNQAQFAARIGVAPNSLGRYKLPEEDGTIGPINDDGTVPRGTVRGWLPETIDDWNARRPGVGARTDLEGPRVTVPPAHDNRLSMVRNRLKLRRYKVSELTDGRFGRMFTIEVDPNGRPVGVEVTDLGPTPTGRPSDIRWGDSQEDDLALTPDQLADRIVDSILS